MTANVAEGGCLCGAVRYRLSGPPRATSLCHCVSCRRAAGAPSVAWVVMNAVDFAIVAGEPRAYASSPGVERTFCGNCGTPLTYRRTNAASIDVTTASLDAPDSYPPTREIWISEKIAWECVDAALPQYSHSSVGASPIAAGDGSPWRPANRFPWPASRAPGVRRARGAA